MNFKPAVFGGLKRSANPPYGGLIKPAKNCCFSRVPKTKFLKLWLKFDADMNPMLRKFMGG